MSYKLIVSSFRLLPFVEDVACSLRDASEAKEPLTRFWGISVQGRSFFRLFFRVKEDGVVMMLLRLFFIAWGVTGTLDVEVALAETPRGTMTLRGLA